MRYQAGDQCDTLAEIGPHPLAAKNLLYDAAMLNTDHRNWEQAWRVRDPAFDGRFFIGVRTTGVYCRCVCPVRLPLRHNIDFLPSAAAAEAAGFRPCLRCRPETAPFCAAWKGTLTTVERAARLIIEESALDTEGSSVEALAERVGVTGRHLARLFVRHWGATPSVVARTARVQRAKRLLDETDLSMVEIALQAGFGSLRRFNAVFAEVYRRPPSEIRRRSAPARSH
jgi:AraC family transcriptional regulator of adaptative response / DNA-3-methyladenine glycosylase II